MLFGGGRSHLKGSKAGDMNSSGQLEVKKTKKQKKNLMVSTEAAGWGKFYMVFLHARNYRPMISVYTDGY